MLFKRPRTVLGLTLIGFSLVALPLIAGMLRAAVALDDLSIATERLVAQGIMAARTSQRLRAEINTLDRNAKQFRALGDQAFLELFETKRAHVEETTEILGAFDNQGLMADALESVLTEAEALSVALHGSGVTPNEVGRDDERLSRMRGLGELLVRQSDEHIDTQVLHLQELGASLRRSLFWQTAALIPVTVALAVLFTVLIARPIRQITEAIHRLGEGLLGEPVTVSGPDELAGVGQRLDWLRRRLKELEREQSMFFRQMSHELKTPLASIREGTELLSDGSVGGLSATQSEVVDILRASGVELEQLIGNLLSYNAWADRRSELELTNFDLAALVQRILGQHRLSMARKGLKVEAAVGPVNVEADREKLRMALDNLISNAVKFSPQGTSIRVASELRQGHVSIDVADAGPGIRQEDRPHIFKPFYQGSTPLGRHVRGTGLGLSVARECVEAHEGTINLLDGPDHGAHFRIRLPLAQNAEAA
ncbi:MAG: ATP-binding protein [Gammaproteobacteria bacterium]